MPPDVAQPCDPIPPFMGKTSDDLVTAYLRLVSLYKQCAARHGAV